MRSADEIRRSEPYFSVAKYQPKTVNKIIQSILDESYSAGRQDGLREAVKIAKAKFDRETQSFSHYTACDVACDIEKAILNAIKK